MKLSWRNISIIAMVIAIACTLYFVMIMFSLDRAVSMSVSFNSGTSMIIDQPQGREADTAFGGIFQHSNIDMTMPAYQYVRIDDSIKQVVEYAKGLRDYETGDAWSFGKFGVKYSEAPAIHSSREAARSRVTDSAIERLSAIDNDLRLTSQQRKMKRDSVNLAINRILKKTDDSLRKVDENGTYYITLEGYSLNPPTEYYVSDGKYWLATVKWDSTTNRNNGAVQYGHYVRKPIGVKFRPKEKTILVPVSKASYRFWDVTMRYAMFVLIFIALYITIGLPIHIIISISRGDAFTPANIRRLTILAVYLFLSWIAGVLGPYIVRALLGDTIPAEFKQKHIVEAVLEDVFPLLAGVGLFLLSRAFKKGYKLQQEQALTI